MKYYTFINWYIDIKIAPNLWYNKITTINKYAKKGANLMIYKNSSIENTQNQLSNAIKELKIGKLLRTSNVTKSCGIPAFEVFQFLLLLVFQGKSLFRFMNSKHKGQAVSKNTCFFIPNRADSLFM